MCGAPKEYATGKMRILIKQKTVYGDPSKVRPPVSSCLSDCINRDAARKREVIILPHLCRLNHHCYVRSLIQ